MMHFDNDSQANIESYLNELPYDYRDTETIREQFALVTKCTMQINAVNPFKMQTIACDKARQAYVNLLTFNNSVATWDFTDYFNSKIKVIIFGIRWSSNDGELYWHEDAEMMYFYCTLPNEKSQQKEYYFYYNYKSDSVIFGYQEKVGENTFDAYKIYALSYSFKDEQFKIQVDCYKDKETYTMTASFS